MIETVYDTDATSVLHRARTCIIPSIRLLRAPARRLEQGASIAGFLVSNALDPTG